MGHLSGDVHRVAATRPVVTKHGEGCRVVGNGPCLGLEHDGGRITGKEVHLPSGRRIDHGDHDHHPDPEDGEAEGQVGPVPFGHGPAPPVTRMRASRLTLETLGLVSAAMLMFELQWAEFRLCLPSIGPTFPCVRGTSACRRRRR